MDSFGFIFSVPAMSSNTSKLENMRSVSPGIYQSTSPPITKFSIGTLYEGKISGSEEMVFVKEFCPGEMLSPQEYIVGDVLAGHVDIISELNLYNHPNIISFLDMGRDDAVVKVIGEYCNGISLHQKLDGHVICEKEAKKLFSQLVSVVSLLSHCGLAHRDLKPAGIYFNEEHGESVLKLVDLGFMIKLPDGEESSLLCGTPLYMVCEPLFPSQSFIPLINNKRHLKCMITNIITK